MNVADRQCFVCSASLTYRRSDARFCGGGCRARASRVRSEASMSGSSAGISLEAARTGAHKRTRTRQVGDDK